MAMKTCFAILFLSGFMLCAVGCNEDNTETEPVLIESTEQHLARMLSDYTSSMECVTPVLLNALTRCAIEESGARLSQSEAHSEHAQKIFHMYTNNPDGYESAIKDGTEAPLGLILVKENHAIDIVPSGSIVSDDIAPFALFPARVDSDTYGDESVEIPGEITDLFFMAKVGQGSIFETDNGWVYGGMNLNRKIISISSVGNCHECHKRAPNDRLFGLPKPRAIYMGQDERRIPEKKMLQRIKQRNEDTNP
jgi:hypothetical protein